MCDLQQDIAQRVEGLAPDDTTITVLKIIDRDCLCEWRDPGLSLVLRGWARAEDNPQSTRDITWYSRPEGRPWADFLSDKVS